MDLISIYFIIANPCFEPRSRLTCLAVWAPGSSEAWMENVGMIKMFSLFVFIGLLRWRPRREATWES